MPKFRLCVLFCVIVPAMLIAVSGCAAGSATTGGGGGGDDEAAEVDNGNQENDNEATEEPADGGEDAEGDTAEAEGEGEADGEGDTEDEEGDGATAEPLLIFHNDSGPMCLDALDWLAEQQAIHPELVIKEHLTFEDGETDLLRAYVAAYDASEGVSTSFEYLPIIFFDGRAFSGFSDAVAEAIESLL